MLPSVFDALQLLRTPVLVANGSDIQFANDAAREWLAPLPLTGNLQENPALETVATGIARAREQKATCVLREAAVGPHVATVLCSWHAPDQVLVECAPLDWHFETRALEQVADRQALRSRFLKGLAHELRNPLAGMLGAAQLTRKKLPQADQQGLHMIEQECRRMDRLLKDMLLSAKTERLASCDLHALLEDCLSLLQHEFSLDVSRRYDPSIPALHLDRDSLQQGVLNLLRNAAQSGATQLTVTTRIEHGKRLNATRAQTALVMHFDDNGCGVSEAISKTLFFPLVSDKPAGTGLGLAQVQAVVTAHGGLVEYTPRTDGSRFSVYLPLNVAT